MLPVKSKLKKGEKESETEKIPTQRVNYREEQIPPCALSTSDLRSLYKILNKQGALALDAQLASWVKPEDVTLAKFEEDKGTFRTWYGVGVGVQRSTGFNIAGVQEDALEDEDLPRTMSVVTFDSAVVLQNANVFVANKFRLVIDFSDPPGYNAYNPWEAPTPNGSLFIVEGPDSNWVSGVRKDVLDFFDARRKKVRWLHSALTFSIVNWVVGFPLALWGAFELDKWIFGVRSAFPPGLRIAADVYFVLLCLLLIRSAIWIVRWLFPVVELQGSKPRSRGWIVGGLGALAFSIFGRFVWTLIEWLMGR